MIDPVFVAKKARINEKIASRLLEGIDRDSLSTLLGEDGASSKVVEKRRMNLIGGLRSLGFQVEGGRRASSEKNIYRIIGWTPPEPKITIDEFDEERKSILNEIHSWPFFSSKQSDIDHYFYDLWSTLSLSPFPDQAHEKSLLQLICYEVSKNRAYIYYRGPRLGVVIQKFNQRPVFKLFPGTLNFDEIVEIATKLQKVSFRKVKISPVPKTWIEDVKDFGWKIEVVREALVNIDRIVSQTKSWAGKKGPKELRRLEKEIQLYRIDRGEALISEVIDEWRKINEPKQRQLSIVRDYLSSLISIPSTLKFIALRGGSPVATMILDPVCGIEADTTVAQIVEKSLNYRQAIGGRSGTSDFNLWACCRELKNLGFQWINLGHIHGAEQGLAERKIRLADEVLDIHSIVLPEDGFFKERE